MAINRQETGSHGGAETRARKTVFDNTGFCLRAVSQSLGSVVRSVSRSAPSSILIPSLLSTFYFPTSHLPWLFAVIYQFIPVAAGRVMERLIRSMRPGTMAVLDLEDGYLDVRDPGKTRERRASGRRYLLELCANANGRPVVLRVNVAGLEDFMCDLPVVRAVAQTFGLAAVMLPKVESADQVRRAHADLSAEGVDFGVLVPMVETRKEMDRSSGSSFEECFECFAQSSCC